MLQPRQSTQGTECHRCPPQFHARCTVLCEPVGPSSFCPRPSDAQIWDDARQSVQPTTRRWQCTHGLDAYTQTRAWIRGRSVIQCDLSLHRQATTPSKGRTVHYNALERIFHLARVQVNRGFAIIPWSRAPTPCARFRESPTPPSKLGRNSGDSWSETPVAAGGT